MTTVTGQTGTVKDGGTAVAEVTSFSVNQSADTVEDTAMGDTWRTRKATFKSWTATINCHYDITDTTGQGAFDVGETVDFEGFADKDTSGGAELSGSAIVTARNVESEMESIVSLVLEVEGTGALTESAVT